MITVKSTSARELVVVSKDIFLVNEVNQLLHSKSTSRGRTLSERLRCGDQIAKEFDGTVVGRERVRDWIRDAWARLLERDLWRDPSQINGQRMSDFHTWPSLLVRISAVPNRALTCGGTTYHAMIHVGDRESLIVYPSNRPRWCVRWEKLVSIQFTFLDPPTSELRRFLGRPNDGG